MLYFSMTSAKGDKLVVGQALIPLNLTTLAVVRLDVDETRLARIRPVFESLLFSMNARDTQDLDKERKELIQRSQQWKRSLTSDLMRDALITEQWFKIVEHGRDVGFLFIVQGRDTNMNTPGIRVNVGTRMEVAGRRIDSMSRFFLTDEGKEEQWSIRTSSMPLGLPRKPVVQGTKKDAPPQVQVWSESGVRSDYTVKVDRSGPDGVKRLEWVIPAEAYLSQVELYLLGALLPVLPQRNTVFMPITPTKAN
ncbi:MAG: hypothetical protein HC898_03400 [Phycisphaerales bacterium]|nr:hypothetical protein [Phycisphaerales bacterium]